MHQAHTLGQLPGRFRLLQMPPGDTAPAPIAEALDTYRDLGRDLRAAQRQRRDLKGVVLERQADAQDAELAADGKAPKHRAKLTTDRDTLRLRIAGLEVRLDRALHALLDALHTHGHTWAQTLTEEHDTITNETEKALAAVETGGRRIAGLRRLSQWMSRFPDRSNWGGTVNPIPDNLRTPLSTLQRYLQGEITKAEIGITDDTRATDNRATNVASTLGRASVTHGDDAA